LIWKSGLWETHDIDDGPLSTEDRSAPTEPPPFLTHCFAGRFPPLGMIPPPGPEVLRLLRGKRVGVLYGGWSAERPISLKSGTAVRAALRRLAIPHVGIDLTRRAMDPVRRARLDLAFLALHGPFGEDGCLQGLLEILGIPYTGCGVLASALAMHKPSAKRVFQSAGLATPDGFSVTRPDAPPPADFRRPWVVKPASQGSAIGVSVIRRKSQWRPALRRALAVDREVLVERFIEGVEITVGILGDRALPVVEIVPKHGFYDFYSKYAKGGSRHLIPARLPEAVQRRASRMALDAFAAIQGRHFGRADLMVSRDNAPWLLEVNTLPGLTDVSLLPDAARAAGLGFDDLILEILRLAWQDAVGPKARKPRPARAAP
jgi:D-alanine-D-alanine ligase